MRRYEDVGSDHDDWSKGKKAQHTTEDDDEPTEQELDFLLKYLTPTYLTPDTLAELSDLFADESSLRLDTFLSRQFSSRLRAYLEAQESQALPSSTVEIERQTPWRVARPPHKHRFLYQQSRDADDGATNPEKSSSPSPLRELLDDLLPSTAFRKWLAKATGLTLTSYDVLARRFRRGMDYTLATGYEEENSRLEITLGITPSRGWGDDDEGEGEGGGDGDGDRHGEKGEGVVSGNDGRRETEAEGEGIKSKSETVPVGGYEVYMAGDDDDDDSGHDDAESDHGIPLPSTLTGSTSTTTQLPNNRPASEAEAKVKEKTKTQAQTETQIRPGNLQSRRRPRG